MADKTYNVLNYTTSPVSIIINRHDSILIEKGSDDAPTIYPLTESEILYANNTTNAFKSGILRFEPEYEEQLYDLCRIRNWKEIMTNKEIEDIFMHFKLDKFKELIKITDASYFNRIYGVFIGLRNAGLSIPKNVEQAMSLRYKELANGITHSKIVLTPVNQPEEDTKDIEIDALKAELENFKKMFADLQSKVVTKDNTTEATTYKKPTRKKEKTEDTI